jgi:RNA polymerase-binding transcription factor
MDLELIKEKVLKEISKTEKTIVDYKEQTKPVAPDVAIGRISRMDAINNKSITEASLRQANEKLRNLQLVLGKIGTPEFGRCMRCGNEIPLGRILFRPESLFCVNCAR